MDIIYSHGHCPDGWTAALIARRKYPEARVTFLDHGMTDQQIEKLVENVSGKDVLMTDFSLRTRDQNDRLVASAKSFKILDHHKTAQAVLDGAPYAVFDMKRSGAGITWDYLFGKDSGETCEICDHNMPDGRHSGHRPWYVNYVEDRDLWNWKLADSREICAYLGTLPFTVEDWDRLEHISLNSVRQLGAGALAHIEHYVREAVENAQSGFLFGYKTAVLNVPYLNCSEVGHALAQVYEVSLTWFERKDGFIQFSLRSIGDTNVSSIAKRLGGGGHRNAAGFQLPYLKGRCLIDAVIGRTTGLYELGQEA